MKKLKALQIAIVILSVTISAILFTSCQNEPTPVESKQTSLPKFTLPAGATFQSAKFYIWVEIATNQNIDVHRITSPWEECSTSWTSFGSSYASVVEGTFNASSVGWHSVDVTSLVGSWLNGTNPNYGLLLDQVNQTWPRTMYMSSRNDFGAYSAYLEILYTENGGPVISDTTRCIGDTYIYQIDPGGIYCNDWHLYTGWGNQTDLEKQTLIQFDLGYTPPPPPDVCETAYAYGGEDVLATCFIGLPGNNSNNWGWTNYIDDVSADFSYEWPIYAGAGGCDFSGKTPVGTVTVDYNASTDCITLDWDLDPEYTLDEYHLWVSEESLLPQRRNGNYITAPGQFNHNGETEVCNLNEPFWIAIHWGVCHPATQ